MEESREESREEKSREARDWLLTEWCEGLCQILESMADERPVVNTASAETMEAGEASIAPAPGALPWVQSFEVLDKPAIWIATSPTTCLDIGRRTLAAAGVNTVEESECSSTYLEILSQSMSALGASMGANWRCAADATVGKEASAFAKGLKWVRISLTFSDAQLDPIWFAASDALLDRLVLGAPQVDESSFPDATFEPANPPAEMAAPVGSKIFDLLLDIALPVSISFGRTLLPIKEVLRLTSGSIVELDRAINEPVEVIVNNCIIARGEVVVIEGNYGVRIQEIASRDDRLRTGAAASQVQRVLPAA